jgi:S-adenosylmethionine synthetase
MEGDGLMAGKDFLFTSESVSEGHPDKMCDQISDGILDGLLAQDPDSRVACETLIKTGMVVVAGEITTNAQIDYPAIIRQTVRDIGFDNSALGFDGNTCAVMVALDRQSPDISQGVTAGQGLHNEQGAGDQGMMFGYACDETKEFMPFPIYTAHRLVQEMAAARKRGDIPFLRPDSKSQVTVEYKDGRPVRADTVLISTQHDPDAEHGTIKEVVIEDIIKRVVPPEFLDGKTSFLVNPTGRFVHGVRLPTVD